MGQGRAGETGAYIVLVPLARATSLRVGRLGQVDLPSGTLAYVGSAMGSLVPRVRRHLAGEKRIRWHIDWLTTRHPAGEALLVATAERIECALAEWLRATGWAPGPRGFGASDCRCPTHLFHAEGQVSARELLAALPERWRGGARVLSP
jgi:Uri superfamily endonuclease